MRTVIDRRIAMAADLPPKPEFGQPCNGCGMCCYATACEIAVDWVPGARFGQPCPALLLGEGRTLCGMVVEPSRFILKATAPKDVREKIDADVGPQVMASLSGDNPEWAGRCDSGRADNTPGPCPDTGLTLAEWIASGGNFASELRAMLNPHLTGEA